VLSDDTLENAGAAPGLTCGDQRATLRGTDGADRLVGTPRRDVIQAGAGDDLVDGRGGGDLICGGPGDDMLRGGASVDALRGDAGNDLLQGDTEDDVLLGGPGDDRAEGGDGYDVAYGASGRDACVGNERSFTCEAEEAGSDLRLPTEPPRAIPCDYLASSRGDDGAPGSVLRPFRTAEHLVNTLKPGEIGCLAPGEVFEEPDQEIFVRARGRPGAPIILQSQPGGPEATIRGRIYVCKDAPRVKCSPLVDVEGAHDVVFRRLVLDGRNELRRRQGLSGGVDGLPSPTVDGDRVLFDEVRVTNHSTGPCFIVGSVLGYGTTFGTEIRRSRIFGCGRTARILQPAMLDQALSIEGARRTWIHDNLIHDNADNGVYFYSDAQDSLVEHNVIDRNGRGLRFDGGTDFQGRPVHPDGNRIRRNVISNSRLNYPEQEHWQVEGQGTGDPQPWGNTVTGNCLFHPRGRNFEPPAGGQAFSGNERSNVIAARGPGFVDRRDFRLRGGRGQCPRDFGPRSLRAATQPAPRFGRTVGIAPAGGRRPVIRRRGTRAADRFLPLIAAAQIPATGSVVDATSSAVRLRYSTPGRTVQTAFVSGGAFGLRQAGGRRGFTELTLQGDYVGASAVAAQDEKPSRKKLRKVAWKGKCSSCRVKGKWASASRFRSTFTIEDRRTGTLVR